MFVHDGVVFQKDEDYFSDQNFELLINAYRKELSFFQEFSILTLLLGPLSIPLALVIPLITAVVAKINGMEYEKLFLITLFVSVIAFIFLFFYLVMTVPSKLEDGSYLKKMTVEEAKEIIRKLQGNLKQTEEQIEALQKECERLVALKGGNVAGRMLYQIIKGE